MTRKFIIVIVCIIIFIVILFLGSSKVGENKTPEEHVKRVINIKEKQMIQLEKN